MCFFKVVIEGLVDGKSWGDIAVDDIKVLNGLNMVDCKGEAFSDQKFSSWSTQIWMQLVFVFLALHKILISVWTDPDVPTEPMLPEDRLNEIRKSFYI